jgi:hypothetical protein
MSLEGEPVSCMDGVARLSIAVHSRPAHQLEIPTVIHESASSETVVRCLYGAMVSRVPNHQLVIPAIRSNSDGSNGSEQHHAAPPQPVLVAVLGREFLSFCDSSRARVVGCVVWQATPRAAAYGTRAARTKLAASSLMRPGHGTATTAGPATARRSRRRRCRRLAAPGCSRWGPRTLDLSI